MYSWIHVADDGRKAKSKINRYDKVEIDNVDLKAGFTFDDVFGECFDGH